MLSRVNFIMKLWWLLRRAVKCLIERVRLPIVLIESCNICGREQPLVWWCDSDELWKEVTGYTENGIMCLECFDRQAEKRGISLRWKPFLDHRFDAELLRREL